MYVAYLNLQTSNMLLVDFWFYHQSVIIQKYLNQVRDVRMKKKIFLEQMHVDFDLSLLVTLFGCVFWT